MIPLLIILYGVIPAVQFILFLMDLSFFGFFELLNYFFSIITYYLILNNILITLKIPVLQKWFPYDKMVKFHVTSGVLAITGLLYHVLYKLVTGYPIDALTWFLLVLSISLYVLAILWIEAPGVRNIRRRVLKRSGKTQIASYDKLKFLHGYAFLFLAFIAFLHVRSAGLMDGSYRIAAAYPLIHFVLVGVLFTYSHVRKLWLPHLEIIRNSRIHDVSVLTFSEKDSKRIAYRAGQFGYIRWKSPGLPKEEHPFSFLSCPSDPHISMAIKILGDFTRVTADVKPGTVARINGGFGNFIPDYAKGKVCLIGSGIGIVPIVSLLKDMRDHQPEHEVICFLSVNTREDLLAGGEIEELAKSISNLHVRTFIYTEDGLLYSTELFRDSLERPQEYDFYLCSSLPVRTIVLNALKELEVHPARFHFESFSY